MATYVASCHIMQNLIKRWETHRQSRQQRQRPQLEIVMDPSDEVLHSWSRIHSPKSEARSPSTSEHSTASTSSNAPSFQQFLQSVPLYHEPICGRDSSKSIEQSHKEASIPSRQFSTTSSEQFSAPSTPEDSRPPLPFKSPYRLSRSKHRLHSPFLDLPPQIPEYPNASSHSPPTNDLERERHFQLGCCNPWAP